MQLPPKIYLLQVNNKSSRQRCEICSIYEICSIIKAPECRHWPHYVFVNFEHILHLFQKLLFLLDCFFFSPSSVDVIVRLKLSRDALHKIKKTIWIWVISKRLRVKYYMLKLINENIIPTWCKFRWICSKLRIKTREWHHLVLSDCFYYQLWTNSLQHPVFNLAFLFITLNRCLHACWLAQKTKMNFNSCFKLFYLPEFSFRDTNNTQGNGEDDP